MRKILVTMFLFASAATNAATVTIDFEEFSIGDGGGPIGPSEPNPPPVLTSQGYEFTGSGGGGDPFMSAEVITGTNTGGTNAYGGSVSGLGQDGFNFAAFVHIEKADRGAFAIHTLDLFLDTDPSGRTEIRGISAETGLSVILTDVTVGTGGWLNLESITFRAEGNGFGPGGGAVEVDNIVVSAVPVPAAVWLFGSALAGLGWLKRKQVV